MTGMVVARRVPWAMLLMISACTRYDDRVLGAFLPNVRSFKIDHVHAVR